MFECVSQRLRVNNFATCRIDDDRRKLHQRQFPRADQVMGFGQQRRMDGHEIAFAQQVFERCALHTVAPGIGLTEMSCVDQDWHLKTLAAAGHGLPDSAITDDTQSRPVQRLAQQQRRLPGFPLTRSRISGPGTIFLATPSIRAKAMSAVLSVRTPGVCPTGMPRALAASRSMLLTPTA